MFNPDQFSNLGSQPGANWPGFALSPNQNALFALAAQLGKSGS